MTIWTTTSVRIGAMLQRNEGNNDERTLPGILATRAPIVNWLDGIGFARVELAIEPTLVERWALEAGIPFRKDHDRGVDATIGRIRDLRADGDVLRGLFYFDEELGAPYYGPANRGVLTDVSVGADIFRLELLEPGDKNDWPLYRAVDWIPREGSLTDFGADPAAKLRRTDVKPKQLRDLLTRMGLSKDAIERAMNGDIPANPAQPTPPADPQPAPEPPANGSRAIDVDSFATALVRAFQGSPSPEPSPEPERTPLQIAHLAALDDETLSENVIERALDRAQGDVEIFGRYIARHKAGQQKAPDPAPRVTGGDERKLEAVSDAVVILRAHAAGRDGEAADAATKLRPDWRQTTAIGILEEVARAHGLVRGVVHNKTALMRTLMATELAPRQHDVEVDGMPGMHFVRGVNGVVPANLPAILGNVLYLVLMPAYQKARLPMERLSRRQDVVDFRAHEMAYYDIAGSFQPLRTGELLHTLSLRDKKASFEAQAYGHVLVLDYRTIIQDNLGMVGSLAMRIGDWCGSQESRVFEEAIATHNYQGNYDLEVDDPTNFGTHLEAIRNAALEQVPIPAGENEDPKNDPGKSRALVPTVMLGGRAISTPFTRYTAEVRSVAISRNEAIRTDYERTLGDNYQEGLYLDSESYSVWPGPESPFCPVVVGQVIGEGMTVTMHETTPLQQKGLVFRLADTFAAKVILDGIYRVRKKTA